MPEPEEDLGHALAIVQLITIVEEDIARMKAGLEPHIKYIWHRPPKEVEADE